MHRVSQARRSPAPVYHSPSRNYNLPSSSYSYPGYAAAAVHFESESATGSGWIVTSGTCSSSLHPAPPRPHHRRCSTAGAGACYHQQEWASGSATSRYHTKATWKALGAGGSSIYQTDQAIPVCSVAHFELRWLGWCWLGGGGGVDCDGWAEGDRRSAISVLPLVLVPVIVWV